MAPEVFLAVVASGEYIFCGAFVVGMLNDPILDRFFILDLKTISAREYACTPFMNNIVI